MSVSTEMMTAKGTATRSTGPTQSRNDKPLANHTTISDSRKFRLIVLSTVIKIMIDRNPVKDVILEKAASPTQTSATMKPAAAAPKRRTNRTLSHTNSNVDMTTPAWLKISDTTKR